MPRSRLVLAVGLAVVACLIGLLAWGGWFEAAPATVRAVPEGAQEIAWIMPATSSESWERLIAALKQLQQEWPKQQGKALTLDLDRAFLDLTADIPEIGLGCSGGEPKLWIRWYKLSGEIDSGRWIRSMTARGVPPLAVIGGDTTDRALGIAEALQEARTTWPEQAPLFCITQATAERYLPRDWPTTATAHEQWPKLMSAYPGHSFRFAFTNSRMVEAVLDFVRATPQVWLQRQSQPPVCAATVAAANPWTALGILAAAGHLQPFYLYTIAWGDDTYSKDLAEIFAREFTEHFPQGRNDIASIYDGYIPYGVGDYYQANPRERIAIDLFLVNRAGLRDEQHLLVLPTGAQRARRFLRTLCRRAPLEVQNLVVVNGDAISFNSVYRDRDVAWNILDMPVPLVFFSHRNPIDRAAGFEPNQSSTGTQDLLLYRDIVEALLHATFDDAGAIREHTRVLERLRQIRWLNNRVASPQTSAGLPFFDADGNRRPGTGEHIVWLHPTVEARRVLPQASITVWQADNGHWRLSGQPLAVYYNRSSQEAGWLE